MGQKKENRGLKNIVTEGKKKDTDICIMKGKRYRGRGKYLVLEKPTPLTTVYANLLTITRQVKVEQMNVFTLPHS